MATVGLFNDWDFLDAATSHVVAAPGVQVFFYNPGATVFATRYDSNGNNPVTGVFSLDASGNYDLYAAPGFYDIKINGVTRRVEVKGSVGQLISAANRWTGHQDFASGRPWFALEALATGGDGSSGNPWTGWAAPFNALSAGSIVRAGPGSFNIDATTPLLRDDVSLEGTGWGTVFRVTGAAQTSDSLDGFRNADPVGGNARVRLANFRIIGPEDGSMATANAADFGKGIWLRKVTDFEIENVRVSRMNIQGIRVDQCIRGKVRGCTVAEISSGNGISVEDNSIDVVVEGNTLHTIADSAIATHNGSLRTVISGNTVTNTNFGRGVDVFGAPETVVTGNTLRDIGGSGAAGHGILLNPGLSGTLPDKCVVANNMISGPAQGGIVVNGTAMVTDITIVGNLIRSAGDKGIYLSGTVRRANVSGNTVVDGLTQGIYIEHITTSIPQQIVVTGNLCRGNASWGILITASVVECLVALNQTRGNTGGQVSAPAAVTVVYEAADGYLQLDKGLTIAEVYITATLSVFGKLASQGANDSGGTGFRVLRVPNV